MCGRLMFFMVFKKNNVMRQVVSDTPNYKSSSATQLYIAELRGIANANVTLRHSVD